MCAMPRPLSLPIGAALIKSCLRRRLLGIDTPKCCCQLSSSLTAHRPREGQAGGDPPSSRLKFDDHREVFSHKTTWELLRGLMVLRICGTDVVADRALKHLDDFGSLSKVLYPGESLPNPRLLPCSQKDDLYDKNLQELLQLAEWTWSFGGGEDQRKPCLQVKATALFSADVLKILAKVYQESSESEKTKLVDQLALSAISPSATPAAWRGIRGLSGDVNEAIYKGARRLGHLGAAAKRKGLTLLVDAEYSYVNEAVSLLALAAMSVYNKDLPIVCHTIQCYFKEARSNLDRELKMAETLGVCYGAKIVRGAYLEQERSISPNENQFLTCSSHEETGQNYKRVISNFMEYAASSKPGKCLVIVATHNERGICHAVDTLHSLNFSPLDGRIVFAQIYGMAEQISMPLVRGGYIVYKSVPVGGLTQVLPYLARRAAENRSVLLGARKERELLQSELLWRLKG